MHVWATGFLLLALLGGCSSGPDFRHSNANPQMTPQRVLDDPHTNTGSQVLWGGVILSIHNEPDHTQIEMLCYPLDTRQRPQQDRTPLGRVVIRQSGFLEPSRYAPGRMITVQGVISGTQPGMVGESHQTFPLVSAEQIHLWDIERKGGNVHFGIGIGIGL